MSFRFLKTSKKCFVLLFVAVATTLITSVGFPKDGLFIDELVGSWTGTGKLLGTDSDFSMQWEWVFDGKFARLTFQNKFLKAEAFYKATRSDQYEGTWFDSRGKVLPLKAKVENATLVTHWGSDTTERGRTVYRQQNEILESRILFLNIGTSFPRSRYSVGTVASRMLIYPLPNRRFHVRRDESSPEHSIGALQSVRHRAATRPVRFLR